MNRVQRMLPWLLICALLVALSPMSVPIVFGQEGEEADSDETLSMAIILKNLVNPYFVQMGEGAVAAAQANNVDMAVLAPEQPENVEEQSNMIENLIQAGIDAIVLVPADSKAIVPAVDKAREAGVPIVAADTRVTGTEVETFVGYDNTELAMIIANWALDYVDANLGGEAQVIILEGVPGSSSSKERQEGFLAVLEEAEGIDLAASNTAMYNRVEAVKVTEDMLTKFPELDVIIAANDEMALGAIEAIEARGLTLGKDVVVTGVNGAENALEAVAAGKLLATIYPNQYCLAYLATQIATDIVRDGLDPDPEIIGEFSTVISKDNVAEFQQAYAEGLKCD